MTDGTGQGLRVRRGRGGILARIFRSEAGLNATASLLAASVRFVDRTSSLTFEPRTNAAIFDDHAPFIVSAWHGQMFMLPVVRPENYAVDVLASRHGDGELIARTLVKLGCGVIRGSGSSDPSRMHERGAVASFRAMKGALDKGHTVALTADFMRDAPRQVSPGVIALARLSGRPVIPVGFASSRRRVVGSWDRTTISLPFGRMACVFGDPVVVAARAGADELEAKRLVLQAALNAVEKRAYAMVDRGAGAENGGVRNG
jgi:lysophospholipid acyltransferase (LPLAT)-like uncharacterized protein